MDDGVHGHLLLVPELNELRLRRMQDQLGNVLSLELPLVILHRELAVPRVALLHLAVIRGTPRHGVAQWIFHLKTNGRGVNLKTRPSSAPSLALFVAVTRWPETPHWKMKHEQRTNLPFQQLLCVWNSGVRTDIFQNERFCNYSATQQHRRKLQMAAAQKKQRMKR